MLKSVTNLFVKATTVTDVADKAPATKDITSAKNIALVRDMEVATVQRRHFLNIASEFKKQKRYLKAAEMLMDAFETAPVGTLEISLYLRLPMYLQLAKNSQAGWALMKNLQLRHTDASDQIEIAATMRQFQQNEGNHPDALIYDIWTYARVVYKEKKGINLNEEQRAKLDSLYTSETIAEKLRKSIEAANATAKSRPLVETVKKYLLQNSTYILDDVKTLTRSVVNS